MIKVSPGMLFSLSSWLGVKLMLNLWQNLTNQPLEALKEFVLLS